MTEKSLLSKALGALKQGEVDVIANDEPRPTDYSVTLIHAPIRYAQTCTFQFRHPETCRTHIASLTVYASTKEEVNGVRVEYH